ncbi:hypothetical protein O6H91_08G043700 [Diphasiastrum complanatum]|nr:hypothetical protein O6H91_08G043700 [Diphasiastrum complanatum]
MFVVLIFIWLLPSNLEHGGVVAKDDGLPMNSFNTSHSLLPTRLLNVGKELEGEKLPLKGGHCFYEVLGLEQSKSYEVKISYPASIPASFSIQLYNDGSKNLGRRLLNTEKLMFHADAHILERSSGDAAKAVILVSVRPAGIVAKRNAQEQPYIFYNILCERVHYGIPQQALWVGLLATVAVLVSIMIAARLPPFLLEQQSPPSVKSAKEML